MQGTFEMFENGKRLHRSGSFDKLINLTAKDKTENAMIYYNGVLVWVQNPSAYYGGNN